MRELRFLRGFLIYECEVPHVEIESRVRDIAIFSGRTMVIKKKKVVSSIL